MDIPTFRAVYPQFADPLITPPEAVQYWITTAVEKLNPGRWADQLEEGIGLFVAHKLALGKMQALGQSGVVSSKSVGGVSIAYNVEFGSVEKAGVYNLTIYGREFITLARMVGMGGIQF